MELLKNHYEKVILSVVLLGVIVYAVLLLGRVHEEQDKIEEMRKKMTERRPHPYKAVDWAGHEDAVKKTRNPQSLEISGQHNLLNSVRWEELRDGRKVKVTTGDEVFKVFAVTKITPLYFTVVFDGPSGPPESVRYRFTITDDGSPTVGGRKSVIRTVAAAKDAKALIAGKNELVVREIRGPVTSPTELVIELSADKEIITVGLGREKSFRRVVGYEFDAKFDPEKAVFKGVRLNGNVTFNGETYKVIAITETDITIEAVSNQLRKKIPLSTAP